MEKILGKKEAFAIGVDIKKMPPPHIWGRSCLWINNIQIGDFEDENILGPFIQSLMRITVKHKSFWNEKFNGVSCEEVFYKIYPFYNEPDSLLTLSSEELEKYESFENFSLYFGENFDNWSINLLVRSELCTFIWVHYPK